MTSHRLAGAKRRAHGVFPPTESPNLGGMAAHGGDYPSRPTSAKKKRGSDDDDLMASASLEVFSATNTDPQGPAMYQATYTRGGW